MQTQAKPPRSKNWLLIKVREWHGFLGVGISAFVLLVCVSGIYLNHKDLFSLGGKDEPAMKEKGRGKAMHHDDDAPLLTTTTELEKLPVTFAAALALAQPDLGEDALEKIELKAERGKLVYKIKTTEERELIVDATTGALHEKGGYKKGGEEKKTAGFAGYDWPKIIKDLHTGKIGGEAGKLLTDVVALIIMGLTLSGLYLWAVPKYRKRKAELAAQVKQRSGTSAAMAV